MTDELGEYAVRAGPAVIGTGLTFAGVTLQDWMYLTAIVYTVLQIGFFLWKRYDSYRKKNGRE